MSIPIFSVHGLIAWLETQDPETEYDYTKGGDCLIQRYLKDRGVNVPRFGYDPLELEKWGLRTIAGTDPYNYAAALARAKELV